MSKAKQIAALEKVREQIQQCKHQIAEVASAGLPAAEVRQAIAHELNTAVDAFNAMKNGAADCLRSGGVKDLHALWISYDYTAASKPLAALGCGLLAYGVDRFIAEAEEQAGIPDGLRLSKDEQQARLAQLYREQYDLELQEEALVEQTESARRHDCNVGAVLGIPYEHLEAIHER